jgi:hypothetical protein
VNIDSWAGEFFLIYFYVILSLVAIFDRLCKTQVYTGCPRRRVAC